MLTLFLSQFCLLSSANANENTSNRIAVVVNSYLKDEIKWDLEIYLEDLVNEGYDPILNAWHLESDGSPGALKAYLKGLYLEKEGLQGAVLIGDLPIPMMEADPILKEANPLDKTLIQITDRYIAEMFYMDLVGEDWVDADGDFILDKSYSEGDKPDEKYPSAEIWVSRLVTSSLADKIDNSEAYLIDVYLRKNHDYRTGMVVFPRRNQLFSLPSILKDDEAFSEAHFEDIRKVLSESSQLVDSKPDSSNDFFDALDLESFEILYWGRHGHKTSIDLGYGSLSSYVLSKRNINIATAFIFPLSCWIGHYAEPNYFAGTYLFNNKFYALAMPTATLPTYRIDDEYIMLERFQAGGQLGASFKDMINNSLRDKSFDELKYKASRAASRNSRYILGDGTLRLQSRSLIANKQNSPLRYLFLRFPLSKYQSDINYYLSESIRNKKVNSVRFLIEMGVDVETPSTWRDTPLREAICFGTSDILVIIINAGADLEDKDRENRTPLYLAVERNDLSMVELLVQGGADLTVNTEKDWPWTYIYGETPLSVANAANLLAMVELLTKLATGETTPLHNAAQRGDFENAMRLIEMGADTEVVDADSRTFWDLVKDAWTEEALKDLVDYSED